MNDKASSRLGNETSEMSKIKKRRVVMPAGIELTLEAEKHIIINDKMHILSVGCGTGEMEAYFAEKYGCKVTGIDIDTGFIKTAKEMAIKKKLDDLLFFEAGDGSKLRFKEKEFDIAYSSGALSNFFENGVKEIHRVLKENGKAIIIDIILMGDTVPRDLVKNWLKSDIKIYTLDRGKTEFQKNGFSVIFTKAFYEPYWWEVYYNDRKDDPKLMEEYNNYKKYREYIGISLFILVKEGGTYY